MACGQEENGPAENDASQDSAHEAPTPAATEGETASESELDIEIERRESQGPTVLPHIADHRFLNIICIKYFRRDIVILQNINLFKYVPNLCD